MMIIIINFILYRSFWKRCTLNKQYVDHSSKNPCIKVVKSISQQANASLKTASWDINHFYVIFMMDLVSSFTSRWCFSQFVEFCFKTKSFVFLYNFFILSFLFFFFFSFCLFLKNIYLSFSFSFLVLVWMWPVNWPKAFA